MSPERAAEIRAMARASSRPPSNASEPRCPNCGEVIAFVGRHSIGMGNELLLEYWLCDRETAQRYQATQRALGLPTVGDTRANWCQRGSAQRFSDNRDWW